MSGFVQGLMVFDRRFEFGGLTFIVGETGEGSLMVGCGFPF
jgi:hypothetical protein